MGTSTNPKDRIGRTKPPLELIPPSAIYYEALGMSPEGFLTSVSSVGLIHESMAFKNGAAKYGPYNWRDEKVSAMIYLGAAWRHTLDLIDGQELASDSGVHHAAHAKACLGIFIDAHQTGNLVDDRPAMGCFHKLPGNIAPCVGRKLREEPASAMQCMEETLNGICAIIDRGASLSVCHCAGIIRAWLGLYLDAMEHGYLLDDRPKAGKAPEVIDRFTEKKLPPMSEILDTIANEINQKHEDLRAIANLEMDGGCCGR